MTGWDNFKDFQVAKNKNNKNNKKSKMRDDGGKLFFADNDIFFKRDKK